MTAPVSSVLGLCLLAVLLVMIAGMALCSHFDAEYFDDGDSFDDLDPHL